MKITMYELLGMVKDGKLPKMIKYHFQSEFEEFYVEDLFETLREADATLNDEVEILDDEDEEKESLYKPYALFEFEYTDDLHEIIKKSNINFKSISEKLNEIIVYLEKQSKGE